MFLIHMYDSYDFSHVTTFVIGCPDMAEQLDKWIRDQHHSTIIDEVSVKFATAFQQHMLSNKQKEAKQELLQRFFEETTPQETE